VLKKLTRIKKINVRVNLFHLVTKFCASKVQIFH